MTQGDPFLGNVERAGGHLRSHLPHVENFLNYLFEEKNLKPSTIAGYRTAIADGLGLKGE